MTAFPALQPVRDFQNVNLMEPCICGGLFAWLWTIPKVDDVNEQSILANLTRVTTSKASKRR